MDIKDFKLKITNSERNKYLDVLELKDSKILNVLYGSGDYANTLFNFLKENQVIIDYVCIDEKFYIPGEWNGISTIKFEEIENCILEDYNLILGFSRYKEAERKLINLRKLSKLYFFDSISFFNFFNLEYVNSRIEDFFKTYCLLQDEKSRAVFLAFINSKLKGKPDELYDLVEGDQYFPSDLISLTSNEVFVDAGAYTGDTLSVFIKKVDSKFTSYYAFEPDQINFNLLKSLVSNFNSSDINIFNIGLSDKKDQLFFKSDKVNTVKSSFSKDGEVTVDVNSLDNIVNGREITFIKMDIEGAEFSAITGAKSSIQKHKPKLAISMYHKPDDLIVLPQLIKAIRPDYKFYLRHHLHITQELVLYAI